MAVKACSCWHQPLSYNTHTVQRSQVPVSFWILCLTICSLSPVVDNICAMTIVWRISGAGKILKTVQCWKVYYNWCNDMHTSSFYSWLLDRLVSPMTLRVLWNMSDGDGRLRSRPSQVIALGTQVTVALIPGTPSRTKVTRCSAGYTNCDHARGCHKVVTVQSNT